MFAICNQDWKDKLKLIINLPSPLQDSSVKQLISTNQNQQNYQNYKEFLLIMDCFPNLLWFLC